MSEEPLAETSGRIYAHSIRVDAASIDENRHANNVVYLQWMNEASLLHFESQRIQNSAYFSASPQAL